MKKEKARRIIEMNESIYKTVQQIAEEDNERYEISKNLKSVRSLIKSRAYFYMFPMNVADVGAIVATLDGNHYIVLNTSIPRGEEHFHLLHEFYHIEHEHSNSFFAEIIDKYSLYNTEATTKEEWAKMLIDRKASLYASLLMIESREIKKKYGQFKHDHKDNLLYVVCSVMEWFEAPFTMSLMRLYEENLITDNEFDALIETSEDEITQAFVDCELDEAVLKPSLSSSAENVKDFMIRMFNSGDIAPYVVKEMAQQFAAILEQFSVTEGDRYD